MNLNQLVTARMSDPRRIAERMAKRERFVALPPGERMLIIAADHPARGALGAGRDNSAMSDRWDLLQRIVAALERPGVHGFLGTADIVEDLTLLGALEGKFVLGSMNRGGLAGTSFEIDDRFTGYDARGIAEAGLDGGKMLLRIDPDDRSSARTIGACARAVDELAEQQLVCMVEPFMSTRVHGRVRNQLAPDQVIRAMSVAAGLGRTSAYTWLKLPVVDEMRRVMAATTLPVLVLGGEVAEDSDAARAGWGAAFENPTVRGLVIGRSLLYPPDGDVATAVDGAVSLLGSQQSIEGALSI